MPLFPPEFGEVIGGMGLTGLESCFWSCAWTAATQSAIAAEATIIIICLCNFISFTPYGTTIVSPGSSLIFCPELSPLRTSR